MLPLTAAESLSDDGEVTHSILFSITITHYMIFMFKVPKLRRRDSIAGIMILLAGGAGARHVKYCINILNIANQAFKISRCVSFYFSGLQ